MLLMCSAGKERLSSVQYCKTYHATHPLGRRGVSQVTELEGSPHSESWNRGSVVYTVGNPQDLGSYLRTKVRA